MSSSYEIVAYEPEFKEHVLELQTQLWSPSLVLNRAYFDWKHEQNPYAKSFLYLALHSGSVVGMRSFFNVRWEAGPPRQMLTALYADDMVIDRNHRNGGLIHKIMGRAFKDLASRGYEYVFNLSAGPITLASSLSMGWRDAGLMRPMRWRPLRAYCQSGMSRLAGQFPILSRLSRGFLTAQRGGTVRSLSETDSKQVARRFDRSPSVAFVLEPRVDSMSDLVERIGSDGRIRHVRDRTYFRWRFQNPLHSYGFLYCEQGEGLEGYLVLKEDIVSSSERRVLDIVDWEATSAHVLNRLLDAARQLASNRKQLVVWSATQSEERMALLAQNGFRVDQETQGVSRCNSPHLLVRALTPDRPVSDWRFAGRRLADIADWDVRMIYSAHG